MSTWEIADSNSSIQSNVKSRQVKSCENVAQYVQACQPLYIDNLTALIKTGTLSKAGPDPRLSLIDLPHPFLI